MKYILAFLMLVFISACSSDDVKYNYPEKTGIGRYERGDDVKNDKIFGDEGIVLFDSGVDDDNVNSSSSASGGTIGINSYLWRASLDTVSFMPISSADPFGGVIITDWFKMPEDLNSKLKINVFILSGTLRSDGVKVTVFKMEKNGDDYKTVDVEDSVARKIEDAILSRARQLRRKDVPSTK